MARVYGSAKEFRQRLLNAINQPRLSTSDLKHAGVYRLLKLVGWRGKNLCDKDEKDGTTG